MTFSIKKGGKQSGDVARTVGVPVGSRTEKIDFLDEKELSNTIKGSALDSKTDTKNMEKLSYMMVEQVKHLTIL
jgi:hypothetical protein